MNDALRIAVAEAGLQAAHVKSTKGLRLRHCAKLGQAVHPGGWLACLVALRWPALSFKAAALLHTNIPTTITTLRRPYLYNTRRLHHHVRSHSDHNTRIPRPNRANADIRLQAQPWPNVCSKVVAPAARGSHSSSSYSWVSCDFLLGLHGTVY